MHITCGKDILYICSVTSLFCSNIRSLIELHSESLRNVILGSEESGCDQNKFCRNLLLGSGNLYHISASGCFIHLALKAYNRKSIQLSVLILVEFLHGCLIDSRIRSEAGNRFFLTVISL